MTTARYLVDTNVLIWLSSDLDRIPARVLETLEDPQTELFISTVSFWELTIKQTLNKLDADINLERVVASHGFHELPVSSTYMTTLRNLPLLHNDPFDRMIIAQAIMNRLTIVTSDTRLADYPVSILRV